MCGVTFSFKHKLVMLIASCNLINAPDFLFLVFLVFFSFFFVLFCHRSQCHISANYMNVEPLCYRLVARQYATRVKFLSELLFLLTPGCELAYQIIVSLLMFSWSVMNSF